MTTIPLIDGANRVLKIKSNNSYIPSTLSSGDNFFKIALLSDSKFANWLSIADTSSKIGIIRGSNSLELSRYMDANYNSSTPEGSLWFNSPIEFNDYFYLQTGASVSISNNSSVFTDCGYIAAHGFQESSGNAVDRCGTYPGVISDAIYNETALLDTGLGMTSSPMSMINLGIIPDLILAPKYTISMLLKISAYEGQLFGQYYQNAVYFSSEFGDLISPNYIEVTFSFDKATYIPLNEFFQLDVVFDGTQTDSDLDIQDRKRYKIYINKNLVELTTVSGHVPTTTPDTGIGNFLYGDNAALPIDGVIDEARINLQAHSPQQIQWRYNQWINTSDYWTVTVQPIISSVTYIGFGRWQINGTGFIPESSNPTGTIGGIPFTVEAGATDTTFIIEKGTDTLSGVQQLQITNSDGESDYQNILISTIRKHSFDSPENYIGMPPKECGTPKNLRDEKYGNPFGDVVDNSSGDNLADGSAEGKPVQTVRGGSSGNNLSMYSKPSWLYSN